MQDQQFMRPATGVETISPEGNSQHLSGSDAMDLSLRPPAARAGYGQGLALAEQLAEFWR